MSPKMKDSPPPPQPAPANAGIQEDKVIEDPVIKRRSAREGLRRQFLTAPAPSGVGVTT